LTNSPASSHVTTGFQRWVYFRSWLVGHTLGYRSGKHNTLYRTQADERHTYCAHKNKHIFTKSTCNKKEIKWCHTTYKTL